MDAGRFGSSMTVTFLNRTIARATAVAALVALPWADAAPAVSAQQSDLTVPAGFRIEVAARVPGARELAALPDGDLIVGTKGSDVYVVPGAEAATPEEPAVYATTSDGAAAGVAFSQRRNEIYIATEHAVLATPYAPGRRKATELRKIATVRSGPIAPHSDGDVHTTTSVAVSDGTDTLYVAVGSSCNACVEADSTRASIFSMKLPNGPLVKRATRIRNAIALAVDPIDGALWAGDAGQDDLPFGHPYEFLDGVSLHQGVADYGWPQCEENRKAYAAGADCAKTVAPLVELPAYSTIIGAVFYPVEPRGRYAFPVAYRGALFAAAHGSWHRAPGGGYAAMPQVVSIAMRDGRPVTPADWQNPAAQWHTFVGGFQANGAMRRNGRPTGLAVGGEGSLFVADDGGDVIYRVRPER